MTDTPTLEDTVEHLDFEEQSRDYNTTLEAVQEYGVPVVEAGSFQRDEETLVTGRTVDNGMEFNQEEFEEVRDEKYSELQDLYRESGADSSAAKKDFAAAFGVALVDRVDEDLIEEAAETAHETSGPELSRNYVNECVDAAMNAYQEAAPKNLQEPSEF